MAGIKNIVRHYIDEVYKVAVLKARFQEASAKREDGAKTDPFVTAARASGNHAGGRRPPPISALALQKWWKSVEVERRESLPIEVLLAEARAANPNYYISREKIRELAGPRKRGPKGFSGKSPAK